MIRHPILVAALALTVGTASDVASAAPKRPNKCFTMVYGANSRGTNAVFERRHLQSGGPTWAAIIESVVKGYTTFIRHSDGYTPDMPGFGSPTIVRFHGAQTWYVLDDEAEAAIFCAGDKALLGAARADYDRLNKDAKALEHAIDGVDPNALE
jgi:hypothetical protein